ncbi:hypothetical protein BKA63DRAFT_242848 [Paraphoma chrysanthemicola]|nr:hypothetical protein BKA63DRAFT_242848 [Paraphoma chrysanthemicola]
MLDGSVIAAILTGILALAGAVTTAWMSGWNEQRTLKRANRKQLAKYSVPLLIASWDLANWFYDILEESNYSPERCAAYGEGWNSQFTSYLLGQYFAGVHITREMTHFFAHMKGERVELLKKLLWKIQDEFISMNYEGKESLEMRWFEGDVLAIQEHMTAPADLDGDGNASEMRPIGWVEFQDKYAKGSKEPSKLKKIFEWYEDDFQRIVYRRFKHLYLTKWKGADNPQAYAPMLEGLEAEENEKLIAKESLIKEKDQVDPQDYKSRLENLEIEIKEKRIEKEKLIYEESKWKKEKEEDPNSGVIIPDHRIRRLQHLLSDLVELLDEVSTMDFNRPVRRCTMIVENAIKAGFNPHGLVVGSRVPCDCHSADCNKAKLDFTHRQIMPSRRSTTGRSGPFKSKRQRSMGLDDPSFSRNNTEKQSASQVQISVP